ncbi:MAG: hypothetical protein WA019_04085 [Candidatus Moraniibacteriota bacterium]
MREKIINWLIKITKSDTNKISDGYHTFEQLYNHRIKLWIALCRKNRKQCWKTKTHSDGSSWDGWFLLGMNTESGKQITYHLPNNEWENCWGIEEIPKAPQFDGHTPDDVISRLSRI